MSSLVGQAAGLASTGVGVYQALTAAPTLFQFQDGRGNTLVVFDATLSETYETSSTPSKFPVEDGTTISDHIVREPVSISLTGWISDTPIYGAAAQATEAATLAASLALPPLGVITAAAAYALFQAHAHAASPSMVAYATLYKLQNGDPDTDPPTAPEPFTCVSKLGYWDNMVITSLSVPRDAQTGGGLRYEVKLQQITVVLGQTIDVTGTNSGAMAAAKQTAGEQQAKELEDREAEGIYSARNVAQNRFGIDVLSTLPNAGQ